MWIGYPGWCYRVLPLFLTWCYTNTETEAYHRQGMFFLTRYTGLLRE